MDRVEITASPKQRAVFVIVAAIMFALWSWSLVPPIENWGSPTEDGFSYVPVFYTTIICLPIGLLLLAGAIAGHGRRVARARTALFFGCGVSFIVAAFLIFQNIANNNDGKIFGIQIGFQIERQDNRDRVPAMVLHNYDATRGQKTISLSQTRQG